MHHQQYMDHGYCVLHIVVCVGQQSWVENH